MEKAEVAELKKKAKRAFDVARHAIVMQFPFIGELSLKMGLVPTIDSKNPTATTDGDKVFIDIEFFKKLNDYERRFVIAHSVWHCALLHQARKGTRDQKLFDLACDMEVNWLLKQNNHNNWLSLPFDCPMPPYEVEGKSCEEIYDWLLKNCQKKPEQGDQEQKQKQKSQPQSDNDDENGSSSEDNEDQKSSDSDKESKGQSPEWECKDKDQTPARHLNAKPKEKKSDNNQFDSHMYTDGTKDEQDDGQGNEDGDFKPKLSKDFVENMREAVISQMQKCAMHAGSMPIGMEDFLKTLDKPEIPWQEQLAQFVTQIHTGKLEWTPPSRRHLYQDLYLQSHRTKKINIALAIDTSGSTCNILPKFFAEVASLFKSFDAYTIYCMHCDCAVEKFIEYSDTNPFTVDAKDGIAWSGGGGTSFVPPFEEVKKRNLDIDAMIYLTDAYGQAPEQAPGYPVLWVLPTDYNKDFCNWGKKVVLKDTKCW